MFQVAWLRRASLGMDKATGWVRGPCYLRPDVPERDERGLTAFSTGIACQEGKGIDVQWHRKARPWLVEVAPSGLNQEFNKVGQVLWLQWLQHQVINSALQLNYTQHAQLSL